MNLKKFANVDSLYRDFDTGTEISWHNYMGRVIEKLGIENIKPYIPFGIEYIKEKLKEDVNLNNTKLVSWLEAAGFKRYINKKTQTETIIPMGRGLYPLFISNGITCFSPSDGVCVLKETARRLCNENN